MLPALQALDSSGFPAELWVEVRAAVAALAARRGSALLLGSRDADQLPLTGGLVAQILGSVSAAWMQTVSEHSI
jgi:hypothetical protein